jgi:hypothetical protein
MVNVILVLLLAGCHSQEDLKIMSTPKLLPSPVVSEVAELHFMSTIAKGVNLNNGIWMAIEPIAGFDNMTPPRNAFFYAVFNFTNEDVVFTREDFNLSVYWYDEAVGKWQEIFLDHYGSLKKIVLPPNLKDLNPAIPNEWYLSGNALSRVNQDAIRLYIVGRGSVSGQLYGAYLDVSMNP